MPDDGGGPLVDLKEIAERARQRAEDLEGFEATEDGIALAFAAAHKNTLRYDHTRGSWFRWDGVHWLREETRLAFCWAREACRSFSMMPKVSPKVLAILGKSGTAAGVERFAQAAREFAVTADIWDRDPWLLGTPGGVVDLRTAELRQAQPDDYITRVTAVAPSTQPECPLWEQFLMEATNGDLGLIRFLKQWCGYMLTGDTREHALLFIYGPGGNGKSVFLNTVARILSLYAKNSPMDTFTAAAGDRHPTDLAMLRGARMVCASETEEGRPWAEVRIKQLTGGDVISARFMRQDFFEFRPEFKLVVIGNHKPVLRNVDDAARRRFNVVPFIHAPPKPDRTLESRLQDEWPGILRWMIEGCIDWQRNGLVRPQVVLDATAEYFSEQDSIKQWVEDCCDTGGRNVWDTTANLFKSWTAYALSNGEKPGTAKWFGQNLIRQGFEPAKQSGKRGFQKIAVKPVDTSDQWQNRMDA